MEHGCQARWTIEMSSRVFFKRRWIRENFLFLFVWLNQFDEFRVEKMNSNDLNETSVYLPYEKPISTWNKLCEDLNEVERDFLKIYLGRPLISRYEQIESEIDNLLEIWREYRFESNRFWKKTEKNVKPIVFVLKKWDNRQLQRLFVAKTSWAAGAPKTFNFRNRFFHKTHSRTMRQQRSNIESTFIDRP